MVNLFEEDESKLKLTHIPQIGHDIKFEVYVKDVQEAYLVAQILWQYDRFQYENHIKPDYCNSTFLDKYDEEDGEWYTWYDEDGKDFDEYMEGGVE